MPSRRSVLGLLLGGLSLALAPGPAGAEQPLRLVGAVQWMSATRMQVMADNGSSIAVDLMEADQASYRGLRPGDWVLIDGVVSPDRRRLIARQIWRDSGRGSWTQSP